MPRFLPEGLLYSTPENKAAIQNPEALREAALTGRILEARAVLCDSEHNLIVELGNMRGLIPRVEGAIGIEDGSTREIALISRVNKPVCFRVLRALSAEAGKPQFLLSRRSVQEDCMDRYIGGLSPGDIIPARVTHLEQFGCFVDIGCGIPSLIPIDTISVSRIAHPANRFAVGDDICAVVRSVEPGRICLSHKELLGTWEENAELFRAGETVAGIVRSTEDYGVFVELTPNLAGLAEPRRGVMVGQSASVYIKAIIPEKMKIKLIIVDVFSPCEEDRAVRPPLAYFLREGRITNWRYSTEDSEKIIESVF